MTAISEVLSKIDAHMHAGPCPDAGCIGECAAISAGHGGRWAASLYIWDKTFNDSKLVAKWFHDLGASEVVVSHVLFDDLNGDCDGFCIDGARAWIVEFNMPQEGAAR